jgi:formylmethanofuran dehydrogenase subunit C
MMGGRVYVAGSVGREMASHMRRGFIAVKGDVGSPAAVRMMGGTIIVCGNMGDRVGIQATRGMIVCLGEMKTLLPTYKFSGSSQREFIAYYLRYLRDRRSDFIPDNIDASETWAKFIGDFAEATTGEELYLRQSRNEHLLAR